MGLQIKFDKRAEAIINFLKFTLKIDDAATVIMRAIALLHVCTEAKLQGKRIYIVDPKDEAGDKEIIIS